MPRSTTVDYDWSQVTAATTTKLRAKRVPPVPDGIVALAQASYSEDHAVKQWTAPSEEVAAQFVKHMKNAGHYTKPQSTVSAYADPFNKGHKRLVHYQAKVKRAAPAPSADGSKSE